MLAVASEFETAVEVSQSEGLPLRDLGTNESEDMKTQIQQSNSPSELRPESSRAVF